MSIQIEPTFKKDDLEFYEVARQEYADGFIASGFVNGHAEDSVYIHLDRPGSSPTLVLLRPDELAALNMCSSAVIWSLELNHHVQSTSLPE